MRTNSNKFDVNVQTARRSNEHKAIGPMPINKSWGVVSKNKAFGIKSDTGQTGEPKVFGRSQHRSLAQILTHSSPKVGANPLFSMLRPKMNNKLFISTGVSPA